MAVLQMQRINICALKKDRKRILEQIQRLGVIEVSDIMLTDSIFKKTDVTHGKDVLEKNVEVANNALEILDDYIKEDTSMLSALNGRTEVDASVYDEFYQKYNDIWQIIKKIISLERTIGENKGDMANISLQMESLKPWVNLDIPLNQNGTKATSIFIGSLPNEWSYESIYEALGIYMPVHVDIISTSREQTCIFVACLREKSEEVLEGLRRIGFAKPVSNGDKPPKEQMRQLHNKLNSLQETMKKNQEEIQSLASYREDIKFFIDFDSMRAEKYQVINHLVQSKNIFVLSGYLPEVNMKKVEKSLSDKFDIAVEFESVDEEEDAPVLLKNNGFATPLESTVEAFSPPGKGEVDPTFIMSLFYYMLFGLMLSDAAYGGTIALACGIILIKKKNLDESMKRTMKMYLYCGLFTIFWGIMFGSYFGDVVDVVSQTFFGKKVTIPPLWFSPVEEPMRMLTFSMLIGLIHIYAGLGMKLYELIKEKLYKDAFYDVISWYILLTSAVLALLSNELFMDILGLNFILPKFIGKLSAVLAILAALLIIMTNGRESRNLFKRFLKGVYALYGISGYLSDVLSYSRLLALGLATGVIGTVINKMGSMAGGGVFGAIVFTLVFLFGHALNLAINALGAYVHTNRLQYVEFFGKFYEGGGRKFNPFSVKTKYYKFKEKKYDE